MGYIFCLIYYENKDFFVIIVNMGYGEKIRQLRGSRSYAKFSEITGISRSHLERMEKEYSNKHGEQLKVPIDSLKQICDRTGYSFKRFLEEAGYIEQDQSVTKEDATVPQLTELQQLVAKLGPHGIEDVTNYVKMILGEKLVEKDTYPF